MSKTDRILENLFTGDREVDDKLRQAFNLGIRHGEATDRESIARSSRIDQTTRMLIALIRTQHIDLEKAMSWFDIPKKDREIYRRIINQRSEKKRT